MKKYQVNKEKIVTAIKRNKAILLTQYGIGFLLILILLLINFNSLRYEIRIIFIMGLFVIPFAFIYFHKKFIKVLNRQYEINDDELCIYELGNLKQRIKLKSINSISKYSLGYEIERRGYKIFILEDVEDVKELIDIIAKKNEIRIK